VNRTPSFASDRVRRLELAAEHPHVRVPQVVAQDDNDVGLSDLGLARSCGSAQHDKEGCHSDERSFHMSSFMLARDGAPTTGSATDTHIRPALGGAKPLRAPPSGPGRGENTAKIRPKHNYNLELLSAGRPRGANLSMGFGGRAVYRIPQGQTMETGPGQSRNLGLSRLTVVDLTDPTTAGESFEVFDQESGQAGVAGPSGEACQRSGLKQYRKSK